MTKNIGTIDRVIRIILGLVLLAAPFVSGLALFNSGIVTAIAVIAGIVMLATSTVRFCPMYRLLGVQTCKL
ncbi:DUF2892 domain-containing protein [uncultured Sulfitobacter sp.]|uniref:YgaP family membrane protein n=1 Tax=uncultured Sulfitobacter sp. TaxID=191468 RepID=UPI002635E924|nr:DUF2892 domain-containing protein [uncultured Sulfitobacter sp.]